MKNYNRMCELAEALFKGLAVDIEQNKTRLISETVNSFLQKHKEEQEEKSIDIFDVESFPSQEGFRILNVVVNVERFPWMEPFLTKKLGEFEVPSFMDEDQINEYFEKAVMAHFKSSLMWIDPEKRPKPKEIHQGFGGPDGTLSVGYTADIDENGVASNIEIVSVGGVVVDQDKSVFPPGTLGAAIKQDGA